MTPFQIKLQREVRFDGLLSFVVRSWPGDAT